MQLNFEQDGYENLFKDALQQGINLFCGAGFSVESFDIKGNKLPVGNELLKELENDFPIVKGYSNLSRACTKLIRTDKQSFYSFLDQRFNVKGYDEKYMVLTKIKIVNIYTTNIDDLFFKIYERSHESVYLNDCSEKGQSYNDKFAVHYFPLHGCIRNSRDYVFGATEIASAFSQRGNEKSWENLANDASKHPILFWGWNFEDAGPIEAMYGNGNNIDNNTKRWVLLKDPDEETLDYLKSLKFNIIVGDTAGMLDYLSEFADSIKRVEQADVNNEVDDNESLRNYVIPSNDNNLTSYPLKKFFLEYTPTWSHIYSHDIPKTINYKKVEDSIASNKDTIIMGIRGSGKTTLMMQLLVDYTTQKLKHFLIAPSVEQAENYLGILGAKRSILFVDDCFRDTYALKLLLERKNVQVVGFDRDFNYERQYHQIKKLSFNPIDITEISNEDAQSIVDAIPTELKRVHAGTKNFTNDPTILNILAMNLKPIKFKFIQDFYKKDDVAAKVFVMISYVHACGTPCSFDMIYSFLGDDKYSWEEMYDIVERAGGLIKDASQWLSEYNIMDEIQNYYQCRSRFLAEKIISSIPKGDRIFAEVLNEFTTYVPIYKICSYDKFKRNAYDSDFVCKAFTNIDEGADFYEMCVKKDENEYIYQQAALYFAKQKDYKKAFKWIERAQNLSHYNRFSIDSTYAQIYFDVNLRINREQTESALDILKNCCENDKRNSVHFASFAKRVILYHEKYGGMEYLPQAISYIDQGLDDKNLSLSKKNKHELLRLKEELNKLVKKEECI